MAYDLGGKVENANNSEYGRADIEVVDDAVLFKVCRRNSTFG